MTSCLLDRLLQVDGELLVPLEAHGLKLMSMGFINPGALPLRGAKVTPIVQQLIGRTAWGELDYLIVDMPPGTGDVQLTLSQDFEVSAAVLVTTPQRLSFVDVVKGVEMFDKVWLAAPRRPLLPLSPLHTPKTAPSPHELLQDLASHLPTSPHISPHLPLLTSGAKRRGVRGPQRASEGLAPPHTLPHTGRPPHRSSRTQIGIPHTGLLPTSRTQVGIPTVAVMENMAGLRLDAASERLEAIGAAHSLPPAAMRELRELLREEQPVFGEIQPRASRDPAEIQPRSSREPAEIQPRASRDPAESQP